MFLLFTKLTVQVMPACERAIAQLLSVWNICALFSY